MVEESVILDLAVVVAVGVILWDRYRAKSLLDDRLDDITEGLGLMANELLSRTEELLKIRDFMPEISLVNQNPLASLGEFIRAMRGDISSNENITNLPRTAGGTWGTEDAATREEEEDSQTRETIDIDH
jgi:hypothetical protein